MAKVARKNTRQTVIPVRIDKDVLRYLDRRRAKEPYKPARSTFIREIIEMWVAQDKAKD